MKKKNVLWSGLALCSALLVGSAWAGAIDIPNADIALHQAISSKSRDPANMLRDDARHPYATLNFFGIRPDMTVVEIWPGAGWYTEILAPYLKDKGHYYAAHYDAQENSAYYQKTLTGFKTKLSANPDMYGKVQLTEFNPPKKTDIAPAGSADMVLTFRNVHNWYMDGRDEGMQAAFKSFYKALKPGGILGVVDHRLPADRPAADMDKSGYMHEAYVIKMAEKAGFKLQAKSSINDNPNDLADHIVWALPPTFANGDKDHDKYAAIGESDRMTLRFVKQ